jgi:hypothetical protein
MIPVLEKTKKILARVNCRRNVAGIYLGRNLYLQFLIYFLRDLRVEEIIERLTDPEKKFYLFGAPVLQLADKNFADSVIICYQPNSQKPQSLVKSPELKKQIEQLIQKYEYAHTNERSTETAFFRQMKQFYFFWIDSNNLEAGEYVIRPEDEEEN